MVTKNLVLSATLGTAIFLCSTPSLAYYHSYQPLPPDNYNYNNHYHSVNPVINDYPWEPSRNYIVKRHRRPHGWWRHKHHPRSPW